MTLPKTADEVIIGGGFIGLKLAYHLKERGLEATLLEREPKLAVRMFDMKASRIIEKKLQQTNTLTGNGAANQLNGLAGNDSFYGGSGNDTLAGGAGKDAPSQAAWAATSLSSTLPSTPARTSISSRTTQRRQTRSGWRTAFSRS